MWTKIHDSAVGLNVWRKWHTCKTKKRSYFWKSYHNGSNTEQITKKYRSTRKLSRVTKLIQNTEKNRNKFSLKDPDTDRSSTLQKRFSNQNSRQRSLASNSSNNVYRKRPFSVIHKKNSPVQGYTNISKSNKSCCQFSN
jgi:hypothetical protein